MQQELILRTMHIGLTLVESTQRRLAPQDTRRLMGSITQDIRVMPTTIIGRVGPTVRYGLWAERGRAPGRRPPIAAIAGWARRHGVNPFALASAIAKRGTRRYRGDPRSPPFVEPSLTLNLPTLRRMFRRVGVQLVAFLSGPP